MALPCVRRRDRWLQRSRPTSLLAGQEDSIPGRAFSKSRPLPQRSRPPLHFFWQARRDSNPQPAPFRSRDRCRSGLDQTHFFWQARRDSNPQPAVLETAALAVGATGLSCRALLRLLVLHVLAAARAELGERELVLSLLLVLRRRVVPLFAGLALERDVVAGHHHLDALRKLNRPRHVRRPEVELRAVPVEERCVAAALLLREDVHLGLELRVRRDRARLREHLPALDL